MELLHAARMLQLYCEKVVAKIKNDHLIVLGTYVIP